MKVFISLMLLGITFIGGCYGGYAVRGSKWHPIRDFKSVSPDGKYQLGVSRNICGMPGSGTGWCFDDTVDLDLKEIKTDRSIACAIFDCGVRESDIHWEKESLTVASGDNWFYYQFK